MIHVFLGSDQLQHFLVYGWLGKSTPPPWLSILVREDLNTIVKYWTCSLMINATPNPSGSFQVLHFFLLKINKTIEFFPKMEGK